MHARVPQNGGHYYFCAAAWKAVMGAPCQVSTLRAKRGHDSAETCVSMRIDSGRALIARNVYRHVCRHVHGHVHGHAH